MIMLCGVMSKIGGWHWFSTHWRLCDRIGKFNPVDKHCYFSSPLCWLSSQHFDHMNLHICSTCLFNSSNLLLEMCTGLWRNTHDPSYCWSKSMSKTNFRVWWQQPRCETNHIPQEHMSDLRCNVNCMYQVHWRSQLRYKWATLLLMHDYTPLHGDVLTLKRKPTYTVSRHTRKVSAILHCGTFLFTAYIQIYFSF